MSKPLNLLSNTLTKEVFFYCKMGETWQISLYKFREIENTFPILKKKQKSFLIYMVLFSNKSYFMNMSKVMDLRISLTINNKFSFFL